MQLIDQARTINLIRDAYKKQWLAFFLGEVKMADQWESETLESDVVSTLKADIDDIRQVLATRRAQGDALAGRGLDFLQNVELPF